MRNSLNWKKIYINDVFGDLMVKVESEMKCNWPFKQFTPFKLLFNFFNSFNLWDLSLSHPQIKKDLFFQNTSSLLLNEKHAVECLISYYLHVWFKMWNVSEAVPETVSNLAIQ